MGKFIGNVVGWLLTIITLGIWYVATSNTLRKTKVKVDESASGIDIALTKRHDLLKKAVSTVKGYAKHEAETLEKVVKLRQPAKSATIESKNEFAKAQAGALGQMNILFERYPDLKANTNFLKLQDQIQDVEEHLQASRRVYNSNVSYLNQKIVAFPTSFIAARINMAKLGFFEADESKRKDIEIEF